MEDVMRQLGFICVVSFLFLVNSSVTARILIDNARSLVTEEKVGDWLFHRITFRNSVSQPVCNIIAGSNDDGWSLRVARIDEGIIPFLKHAHIKGELAVGDDLIITSDAVTINLAVTQILRTMIQVGNQMQDFEMHGNYQIQPTSKREFFALISQATHIDIHLPIGRVISLATRDGNAGLRMLENCNP